MYHWEILILFRCLMVLLILSNSVSNAKFRFNNVKCKDFDEKFSRLETCKLTVPKRGTIALNIYVGLYNSPVSNFMVKMALYKRVNGYQPYLFNITADPCAYLAQPNRYPVMHMVFSIFRKHSNINHTCPYSDALIVKDLMLEEHMFKYLPLPNGQYLFKLLLHAYNDLKQSLEISFVRFD